MTNPTNVDVEKIVKGEIFIDVISVSGNQRTQLMFFHKEMHRIKHKMSINELKKELGVVHQRILDMDIFDSVEIRIEPSINKADKSSSVRADKELSYSVLVDVKEKGMPYLKMSSYVKAGLTAEVGFELSGALRNPLGYGESCKLSSVTTQSGAREFASMLSVPKVAGRSANLNLTLRAGESNRQYYSSFKEHSTSLLLDLSSEDRKHQLTLEYALRDEIPVSSSIGTDGSAVQLFKSLGSSLLAKDAATPDSSTGDRWAWHPSPATMQSLKPSLKTSIKYFCTALDSLDSLSNPSRGSLLQGSIELAMHPGTAQFCRSELSAQHHWSLGPSYLGQPGLVASLCGSLGAMRALPFSSTARQGAVSHLADRYHLGGPTSLRGFGVDGTGPRSDRRFSSSIAGGDTSKVVTTDSLGGDHKSSVLAALSIPLTLPILAKNNARAFVFFNGGHIGVSNASIGNRINAYPWGGFIRASIGGGFSVSVADSMRLEMSYSIPIVKAPHDQVKSFQLGVGVGIN